MDERERRQKRQVKKTRRPVEAEEPERGIQRQMRREELQTM